MKSSAGETAVGFIRSRRDSGDRIEIGARSLRRGRFGVAIAAVLALFATPIAPAGAASDLSSASSASASSAPAGLISDDSDVVSAANGALLSTNPSMDAAARVTPPESSYGEVVTVTVSGRFLTPAGRPAAGVYLAAEPSYGDGGPLEIASLTTGATGAFTLNVVTARPFKVSVRPADGLVGGTLSMNSTLRPGNDWSDGVWILPAEAGASNLGDVRLAAGHVVSGTVTVSGALSPTEALLEVWSDAARFEVPVTVQTGTTSWKVTVPAGSYRASVREYGAGISAYFGGDSEENAAAFAVNGAVNAIGILVTLSGRKISGTVRDRAGNPVAGAYVNINARPWSDTGRSATTAANGTYTLVNVAPGSYELSFSGGGPAVYWPGTDDPDAAQLVSVTSQTTALTGYDGTVTAGVTITGTSTNLDGTPRQGDQVRFVKNGREFTSATTDADGAYRSYALPAGKYAVSVVQGGFQGQIEQWYDGKGTSADANLVDAAEDGAEYANIDFVAVTGGTVSGIIRLADGTPIEEAEVAVFAAQNLANPVGATRTDEFGRYTLPGLKADNYVVKASSGSSGVVDAWFGATDEDPNPQVIDLGIDESVTADIVTRRGGTVRGTVHPAVPGQDISVTLARTDAAGYRSLTLPPGDGGPIDWEISGLEGSWLASVDGRYWPILAGQETASEIQITPGQVSDGIDFDLRAGLNLSASFSTTDGTVIASLHVTVEREMNGWWEQVTTATSTSDAPQFAIALPPGEYRLRSIGNAAGGDAVRDTQTPFSIVEGETTELAVSTARGWAISGRVTDAATGEAVSGTDVTATALTGSRHVTSRSNGIYRLVVGSPGAWSVRASVFSDAYAPSTREVAITDADIDGADIAVSPGQRLSGRVTAENNGNPLSGVQVEVLGADGNTVGWFSTQSDGTYRTSALSAGAYTVRFGNWSGLYITEWWDGAADRASATEVIVDGEAVSGIDASMRLGGVVSGTVRDVDGLAVAGATVGLATLPPTGIDAFLAPLGRLLGIGDGHPILGIEAMTDADGEYELPATEPGSYAMYIYVPGSGTTWHDGQSTLSTAQSVDIRSGGVVSVPLEVREPDAGASPRTPAQSISDDFEVQLQPQNATVDEEETASFSAAASGVPVPAIRWELRAPGQQSFAAVPGETGLTLSLHAGVSDSGTQVRAVFRQGADERTSDAATLTVVPGPNAPSTPVALVVSRVSPTSAAISWDAPANGGASITGYTIRVYGGDDVVRELSASTRSVVISGLTPTTDYAVTVTARNAVGAGSESASTPFATKTPAAPPSSPRGVVAVAGNGQATISWAAPLSDGGAPVTSYDVTARPGGMTMTTGGETTATFTGLINGTEYTFSVKAQNSAGASVDSGVSNSVTPKAPALVPTAPTGVTATAGDRQAVVSWSAPTSDGGAPVTAYTVTAQPGALTASTSGSMGATMTGLSNGTAYTFTVTASNSAGTSSASAPSVPVTPSATTGAHGVTRQSGLSRFDTAVDVSKKTFPDAGVPVVYLANGYGFPDALAGAAAAGHFGGPVLLTEQNTLPGGVAAELDRLDPQRIVILGGVGSISASLQVQVKGYTDGAVTRQAGASRFETAVDVSVKTFPDGRVPVLYIANGYGFPDALSGAAAAGHFGGPVLLTERDFVPGAVAAEIQRLNPQRIVILGGTGSVSAAVQSQLPAFTTIGRDQITRQQGQSRFETAVEVSSKTFPDAGVPVVYLANGYGFPDALAGAAAAGHFDGPVLLTEQNALPAAVAAELDRLNAQRIVILGGTGSVSDSVKTRVQQYVDG